jgi:hypothetical protein
MTAQSFGGPKPRNYEWRSFLECQEEIAAAKTHDGGLFTQKKLPRRTTVIFVHPGHPRGIPAGWKISSVATGSEVRFGPEEEKQAVEHLYGLLKPYEGKDIQAIKAWMAKNQDAKS